MARWYVADSTDAIRSEIDWREAETIPDAPAKFAALGYRWVERVVNRPDYDPATEVREGPVESVTATEWRSDYTVRDKTALELEADKDAKVDELHRGAILALARGQFNQENRLRALEGSPAVTVEQYKTWLKDQF